MAAKKNRLAALLVLFAFSFVIFGSALFIGTHSEHRCTGEACAVCAELAACEQTLHLAAVPAAAAVRLSALLLTVLVLLKAGIQNRTAGKTLISLKVELLN